MVEWLALILAGVLEIAWAIGLKQSDGFTRLWPSLVTIVSICLSFALMAIALRSIPFGTAYAIWAGIGVAGTAVVGVTVFGEPADAIRLLFVALISTGVIGLKLSAAG
jgi:quaternary ammonium compound-resistance protein SugE